MPRPHQHGEAQREAAEQLAGVGRVEQRVAGVAPALPQRQGLAELHFPIPRHLQARTSGFPQRTAPRGGASRGPGSSQSGWGSQAEPRRFLRTFRETESLLRIGPQVRVEAEPVVLKLGGYRLKWPSGGLGEAGFGA